MKLTRVPKGTWGLVGILLLSTLLVIYLIPSSTAQEPVLFDSPLSLFLSPLPMPPTPTPTLSAEAQIALDYVAKHYDVSTDQLVVVNEHQREYVESGRVFRAFTLLERNGQQRFFKLLVDPKNSLVVEDIASVEQAERDAQQQKYGKLHPGLYERFQ